MHLKASADNTDELVNTVSNYICSCVDIIIPTKCGKQSLAIKISERCTAEEALGLLTWFTQRTTHKEKKRAKISNQKGKAAVQGQNLELVSLVVII